MSESKAQEGGAKPVRVSATARSSPSVLLNPFGGPGDFADIKSFQDGSFSVLQLLARIDSREKVTKPYEECAPLRSCLKPIEQAVGSVPILFYRGDPNEDPKAKPIEASDTKLGMIPKLFSRPSPLHTRSQFFSAGVLHRKLDGEDFWFCLDKNGKPVEDRGQDELELPAMILPVRGNVVGHEVDTRGMPRLWRFGLQGGGLVESPANSVVQFKDYNPDDPLRGLGDAETLLAEIDYWWQAMRFNRALAKNSGDPGGYFINEGGTSLAAPEAAALEAKVNQEHGPDKAGLRRLLPKGLKYQANNISPKDMHFVELMKWTRDMIASVLGVPLPVIGVLEKATLANFQDSIRMFWEGGNGILPYLATVEDVLIERFIRRLRIPGVEEVYARFDTRKIKALREDNSKQYELAQKLASAGIGLSLEEALKLVGIDSDTAKMPFAKVRTIASTTVPLDSVFAEDGKGKPAPEIPDAETQPALDENGQPVPVSVPGAGAAVAVQDTALNGAQTASLLAITEAVSEGTLKPDGAVAMILAAFPTISEDLAKRIVAGVNEKPPEPEPVPGAPAGDNPPPTDPPKTDAPAEDGKPDEAKSLTRSIETADAGDSERRAYWEARASRLLDKSESKLRRAYRAWRRKYERAQLARLRSIAADAKSVKAADDGPPLDGKPKFTDAELESLLLNDAEWVAKLRAAVNDPIAQIYADALEDIATDLGTSPIPTDSGEIAQAIARQTIKLAEGHNSTLAEQVKGVLERELSKANSTGSVQQALAETLDSVEESLSETWGDRQNRAQTIARTETGRAVNHARTEQMKSDGVLQHEWVAQNDEATRESHRELDGKVVGIGLEFKAGLREPGDENAPPEETIQCRCLTRPVRIEIPNDGGPVEEQ